MEPMEIEEPLPLRSPACQKRAILFWTAVSAIANICFYVVYHPSFGAELTVLTALLTVITMWATIKEDLQLLEDWMKALACALVCISIVLLIGALHWDARTMRITPFSALLASLAALVYELLITLSMLLNLYSTLDAHQQQQHLLPVMAV